MKGIMLTGRECYQTGNTQICTKDNNNKSNDAILVNKKSTNRSFFINYIYSH